MKFKKKGKHSQQLPGRLARHRYDTLIIQILDYRFVLLNSFMPLRDLDPLTHLQNFVGSSLFYSDAHELRWSN